MTVAFDALGPSSSGQVSTTTANLTWTHTAGTGGGVVLVWVAVGLGGVTTPGDVGSYTGITYGGNAMTFLGKIASNNSTFGGIFCYGITGQASGANTVTCSGYTPGAGGAVVSAIGFSESFTGAGSFGTPVTGSGNAGSGSVAVTGTAASSLCAGGVADGSGGETVTAGTQRWKVDHDFSSGAGNTVGMTSPGTGGTVTMTWTQTSDFYGVIGVEVVAAAAAFTPAPNRPRGQAVNRASTY